MKKTIYEVKWKMKRGGFLEYIVYPLSPEELDKFGLFFQLVDYQWNNLRLKGQAIHDNDPFMHNFWISKYTESIRDACMKEHCIQPLSMSIYPARLDEFDSIIPHEIDIKSHYHFCEEFNKHAIRLRPDIYKEGK